MADSSSGHRPHMKAVVAGLVLAAASLAFGWGAPLSAQVESFRTETLAPGVFALVRPVSPAHAAVSNHLVIVDDDGVTLVDSGLTPGIARGVLAEIRRLSDKPLRYIVNTHWHDDHVWGNEVFREAYPDVRIVAHPYTHEIMRDSLELSLERNRDVYADAVGRYENALRTGRTSQGAEVTEAMRKTFEAQQNTIRWFLEQTVGMSIGLPDLDVPRELVLHRPGREIHVRHLGRGNTPGDLVVHLPAEGIVATGDLLVAPVPYSFGSYLGEWIGTLDQVAALGARVIVPGHGEPQRDLTYLRRVQDLLRYTLAEVGKAASAPDADLERVRAAVDLGAWRTRFTGGDPVLDGGFDAFFIRPAVERAWLEVTGRLDPPPSR